MRRKGLIILLFVCLGNFAFAQNTLEFTTVDAKTYKAWSEQRWSDLLDTSELAISNGIDYYYLRMRAGIAATELKKHRKAVIHFAKALEFNSGDKTAKDYYILACINSGYFHMAAWADTTSGKKPKFVTAVVPEFGMNSIDNFESLKSVYEKPASTRNLLMEKELSGPFQYYSLATIHEISPKWQVDQSFSWLEMEKFKQVQYDNNTLLNPGHVIYENAYTVKQFSWYINPKYYPTKNKEVSFYVHSFLVLSNTPDYTVEDILLPPPPPPGIIPDPLDYKLSLDTVKNTDFELSGGISLKKNHLYFSRDWQTSFYKGTSGFRVQTGLTYTFYPYAKSKVSLASSAYVMVGMGSGFVFKQNFRYKPFSFLELEIYGLMGNMTYFTDNNGRVIYNLPDPIRLKAGANITISPFKRLMIIGGYSFSQSSTEVIWNDFSSPKHSNISTSNTFTQSVSSYKYNNNLIFGGLLWAF